MKHPDPDIQEILADLAMVRGPAIQLGLTRVQELLAAMGSPQDHLPPVVHVAGTNGKGSLLAYLKAMLEAAGYKVHRYISPHLVRFNERIQLAGQDIGDGALLALLNEVHPLAKARGATFFESTTALAFRAFAGTKADILLLETGLGGRLDATNVLERPLLTAITPVSKDHMDFLGNSLASIAAEKAGILKRGVPCVLGPQLPEALAAIVGKAEEVGAGLVRYGADWQICQDGNEMLYSAGGRQCRFPMPALAGAHQIANAGTAIACAGLLNGYTINDQHISAGLRQVRWPARLQRLASGTLAALLPPGGELWLDGGHNESAGEEIARWIRAQSIPVHVICGMLSTKDSAAFLKPIGPLVASFSAITIEGEPLSRSAGELAAIMQQQQGRGEPRENIKNAIQCIVNSNDNDYIILICGSLSLAGNSLWQNNIVL